MFFFCETIYGHIVNYRHFILRLVSPKTHSFLWHHIWSHSKFQPFYFVTGFPKKRPISAPHHIWSHSLRQIDVCAIMIHRLHSAQEYRHIDTRVPHGYTVHLNGDIYDGFAQIIWCNTRELNKIKIEYWFEK
jgi:hypothetical protein